MSFWDYGLLAAIGGYMAWLLFRPKKEEMQRRLQLLPGLPGMRYKTTWCFQPRRFLRPFAQIAENKFLFPVETYSIYPAIHTFVTPPSSQSENLLDKTRER